MSRGARAILATGTSGAATGPLVSSLAIRGIDQPWTAYRRNDHTPAEAALVDQLQPQPHTIREEPFSRTDDLRADDHLKLVDKTSP